MNFEPFYCKCESEEQVKELLEKAIAAGADEYETLKDYNWDDRDYWGIDYDYDTRSFSHNKTINRGNFWSSVMRIDFKDLDEHLGLVKETNEDTISMKGSEQIDPLITEQRKQKILELMKLPQHHTIDDWMAGMKMSTENNQELIILDSGSYLGEYCDICFTREDFKIEGGTITHSEDTKVSKITYEGITIWEYSEVEERKYEINKELQELEEKVKVLKSELSELATNE